jgi:stearoyl-CoA desaturase (delta-9 desaturase)
MGEAVTDAYLRAPDERIDWVKSIPFWLIHLAPLLVFYTGVRPVDVALCIGLYYLRMFFLTTTYHRYLAHRAFKMGRVMQFLMAAGGTLCVQKGPLWWAGHHRHHHRYSDQPEDIHSPKRGFVWSHFGWFLCNKYDETPFEAIKDFAKYPELRWLNKYHVVPPTLLALAVYAIGGPSALVVGFFLSTVLLYHGTFFINSLAHVFGRRRYATTDTSRNSFLLSLLTLGEGWHNNHHYYQSTANQGFFWWELDVSYYVLRVMSWLGLVRDLRTPPAHVLAAHRIADGHRDVGLLGDLPARAAGAAGRAVDAAGRALEAARQVARESRPNPLPAPAVDRD